VKRFKEWTDEQINSYIMGVKYSDYPRVFWRKMSESLNGCLSLLDVGCGPGAFALKAAEHGMSVQAVDISEKNINALRNISKEMGLDNVTPILGNWLEVEIEKSDVSVSAYSFAQEIGTTEGIKRILQNTKKIAFFITPYSKIQTDFLSRELYEKLNVNPPQFSGDHSDLLTIFKKLNQPVKYEVMEYDFGMPLMDYKEDTLEKCARYLAEKLQLNKGSKSLELIKSHLKNIITVKNGFYWVPNPRKSVMITWRR